MISYEKRDTLGENWASNRKMSEVAIGYMDLNGNESQKQGMLHKFAEQKNYESNKKQEDDEYGYQANEK